MFLLEADIFLLYSSECGASVWRNSLIPLSHRTFLRGSNASTTSLAFAIFYKTTVIMK